MDKSVSDPAGGPIVRWAADIKTKSKEDRDRETRESIAARMKVVALPEELFPFRPSYVYFANYGRRHCVIQWSKTPPWILFKEGHFWLAGCKLSGFLLVHGEPMVDVVRKSFARYRSDEINYRRTGELDEFIREHTYRSRHELRCERWIRRRGAWGLWDDYISVDSASRLAIQIASENPVEIVRRSRDPLAHFYTKVKPAVCDAVGWESLHDKSDPLGGQLAYDLLYDMCVDLLPTGPRTQY